MPRLAVGTQMLQVLKPNKNRVAWSIEFLPGSVITANTGHIYLGIGHPVTASDTSDRFDALLIPGASHGRNTNDGDTPEVVQGEVWLISDTADQILIIHEDIQIIT